MWNAVCEIINDFRRALSFHSVMFANMQTFIWFIIILPCRTSDLPWCILLLCFCKYYSVLIWFIKKCVPRFKEFLQMFIKRAEFLLLTFVTSLAINSSSVQAKIGNMNRILPSILITWKISFLRRKKFYPWIGIVCWGIMNDKLFNQELSILHISEKDWIHSYTVEICRRTFIVIKGGKIIKQHKI